MARVIALVLAASLSGCATARTIDSTALPRDRADSLRRQLHGHLERARGCMEGPSWVELAFTIKPDGRVDEVEVHARGSDEELLAACVRSRIVSLFFDPAPPERAVRIRRTWESCPSDDAICRLGPIRGADAELLDRITASLAERDDRLRACAVNAGGGRAVLDVRLELAPDGRIMAGQLRRSLPERSPLARCSVGPLLGARVDGPLPSGTVQLSYTYRIAATP